MTSKETDRRAGVVVLNNGAIVRRTRKINLTNPASVVENGDQLDVTFPTGGTPGPHETTHEVGGSDALVDGATAPADVSDTAATGTGTKPPRVGHVHKLGILTTKGDLLGYSTLPARIPIGADGQTLVADSAQALGLKWAAAAGGGHTINDETTALAARTALAFMGAGIAALDNAGAGRTEVIVGATYDAIVDQNDTNAKDKGNVYSTLQGAFNAGGTSVFLRSAADVAADGRLGANAAATGNIVLAAGQGAAFPAAGYVLVENEVAHYTSKTGDTLNVTEAVGTGRGAKGTVNVAHTQDSGTRQGAADTVRTLTDSTKVWAGDEHKNKTVTLTGGTGSGQTRRILYSTATVLTIDTDWTTIPDNTSTYRIDCDVGTCIGIGAGDGVRMIIGEDPGTTSLPVHLISVKADILIQYLLLSDVSAVGRRLVLQAVRNTVFGCACTSNGRVELAYGGASNIGSDTTLVQCQFRSCTRTPLLIYRQCHRFRVISCTWLSCTGPNLVSAYTEVSGTPHDACTIIGCTIADNTCSSYLIEGVRNTTVGNSNFRWLQFTGNVISVFNVGVLHSTLYACAIAGNIFNCGAGAGQTVIMAGGHLITRTVISGNTFTYTTLGSNYVTLNTDDSSYVSVASLFNVVADNFFDSGYLHCFQYMGLSGNVYGATTVDVHNNNVAITGGLGLNCSLVNPGTNLWITGVGIWQAGGGENGMEERSPIAVATLVNGMNSAVAVANAPRLVKVQGPTAAFQISGITNGRNGQRIVLWNAVAQNMTIQNEDAVNEATAANRIHTMTGANIATTGEGAVELIYDSTLARWIAINLSA